MGARCRIKALDARTLVASVSQMGSTSTWNTLPMLTDLLLLWVHHV